MRATVRRTKVALQVCIEKNEINYKNESKQSNETSTSLDREAYADDK